MLASWIGRASPAPAAFTRVQVLAEPLATAGALVVHTPQGLRMDGLDLDSLVTLLRSVRMIGSTRQLTVYVPWRGT
jgi:hypothetical protein